MLPELKFDSLESNIWKLYVFKALYGFFLSIPIIVLFWKSNGLSMFEVMVLQSLFAVSVIVLEVPTGYFADRYGRRKSLTIAATFATFGITAFSIGHGFLDFLIGEFLWSIGVTLVSGADSALFYDTLVELGEEKNYKEKWGNASFYYMISAAVAAVLGGLIADMNLRWTLYAQIPVFAAMIPLAYSLKEPEHHRDVSGKEKKTMVAVVTDIFRRPRLRNLVFYAAVISATLQVAFWFYQPYFELSGLDVAFFGFIFAGFNIVSAVSSKYAHVIEERLGVEMSLVFLTALTVSSIALMSSFVFVFSFVFIFLQQFVRGFSKPVISDYVNQIINSENRSTILSSQSLLGRVFMAVGMPVFGLISDVYSVTQALSVLAATIFVFGTVFLVLMYSENMLQV